MPGPLKQSSESISSPSPPHRELHWCGFFPRATASETDSESVAGSTRNSDGVTHWRQSESADWQSTLGVTRSVYYLNAAAAPWRRWLSCQPGTGDLEPSDLQVPSSGRSLSLRLGVASSESRVKFSESAAAAGHRRGRSGRVTVC